MRTFWLLFALASTGVLIFLMCKIPPDPAKEIKHSLSGGKIPLVAEDTSPIKHSCDSTGHRSVIYVDGDSNKINISQSGISHALVIIDGDTIVNR